MCEYSWRVPEELNGTYRIVPKINMGPFASKDVISEIQISHGQWIISSTQKSEGLNNPFLTLLVVIIVVLCIGFLTDIWSKHVKSKNTQ